MIASSTATFPLVRSRPVDFGDKEHSGHDGDAEDRNEADGRGHAERDAAQAQGDDAADNRKGHVQQHQTGVHRRFEGHVQQTEHQQDRQRHDEAQPPAGARQVFELAAPFDPISRREEIISAAIRRCASATNPPWSRPRMLVRTLIWRRFSRRADDAGAVIDGDLGQLGQRDAESGGGRHDQIADRIDRSPRFRDRSGP